MFEKFKGFEGFEKFEGLEEFRFWRLRIPLKLNIPKNKRMNNKIKTFKNPSLAVH